jgi:hypothetical protein
MSQFFARASIRHKGLQLAVTCGGIIVLCLMATVATLVGSGGPRVKKPWPIKDSRCASGAWGTVFGRASPTFRASSLRATLLAGSTVDSRACQDNT